MKYDIMIAGIAMFCLSFAFAIIADEETGFYSYEDYRFTYSESRLYATLEDKELTVYAGAATITFMQGASGRFERIKIEGGDTGFYWDENGNKHFCIGGIEVEAAK